MKIINIILTSQNGGAEQAFIDYAVVLKNLGHEVVAIVKEDAPYADKISELGIATKKIANKFGDHDIFASKQIRKIIKEFQAETVVAHIGRSVVLSKKAIAKIKDRKVFLVAVNHSMNVKRSIGADLIFSVNREVFHRTIDAGQAEDSSFVMHNAIDLSDAIAIAPRINLVKQEVVTIGAMGRLDDKKGFDDLVKTLAALDKICAAQNLEKTFKLKIAGSGFFEKNLRELSASLNLQDRVEFCGWVQDKKSFFADIDIFCSASDNETFGLVLLEAIKYRKPVIATNTFGSQEVLRDRVDGLLVELNPRKNLDQRFAEAIIEVIQKPELFDAIVDQSFARMCRNFSYAALENRFKEIFGCVVQSALK